MDELLKSYIFDSNNPYTSYDLANNYKENGEYSSAISFYIKCKENTNDIELQRECILKCIECLKSQGNKDNFIQNVLSLLSSTTNCEKVFKNQIPVIGVPIVNGIHWLRRLVDSIDYPVKNLLIINNNGRNQIDQELNQIRDIGHPLVENIHICHMPSNLGVSMSWNLIIKSYIMEPYWIISNHDVAFTPGLLEKMYYCAENSDYEMIHAKQSSRYDYSGCYDLFLIKDAAVQKCGLFDENLSPAYCEDIDYMFRVDAENIKRVYLDIDYLHGEKDYATSGSQTWRTDLSLKEKLFFSGSTNDSYIYEKWGFQPGDYNRAYEKPFNNQLFDNKQTRFDLEFIRKKNLGF